MSIRFLITLLGLGLLYSMAPAQSTDQRIPAGFGAIEGRVVDADGSPVAGVKVYAEREGPDGILPVVLTNKNGRFFLRLVQWSYRVFAAKDVKGYEDVFTFSNFAPWVVNVSVHNSQVTRGIVVRLNTRQAKLVGQVKDAKTGKIIVNPKILLCREVQPKHCVGASTDAQSASNQFRLLIPSVPLGIKVSAPGYQDWYYGKDGSKEHAEPLKLDPNSMKEITVLLQPK